MCPVTLYATIDGSEPGLDRYNFVGPPPLSFKISQSLCVKAVAMTEENVPSTHAAQEFTRHEVAGIGALLGKISGLKVHYQESLVHATMTCGPECRCSSSYRESMFKILSLAVASGSKESSRLNQPTRCPFLSHFYSVTSFSVTSFYRFIFRDFIEILTWQVGDEIKSIDGVIIENFELKVIERMVLGPVGSQARRFVRHALAQKGLVFVVT